MTSTFDVVYPQHRERHNGIADYSVDMARGLMSLGHGVRLLSAGGSQPVEGIEDLDAWPAPAKGGPVLGDLTMLFQTVLDRDPDVLIVHFEQFSYGTRGWNPRFSRFFGALKRKGFKGKCVLIAHETYTPPGSIGHTVMSIYQRRQVECLVRQADAVVFSSQRGVRQLGYLNTTAKVLPIPSSIPVVSAEPSATRRECGIDDGASTVLLFGALGDRAYLDELARAVRGRDDIVVVYVGKGSGTFNEIFSGARALDLGVLPDAQVSAVMQAVDLGVVAPVDGISARRTSFAAMALHGLPVVSFAGPDTDQYLLDAAQTGALYLASDPADLADEVLRLAADPAARSLMRAAMGTAGLGRTPLVNAQELLEFIGQA